MVLREPMVNDEIERVVARFEIISIYLYETPFECLEPKTESILRFFFFFKDSFVFFFIFFFFFGAFKEDKRKKKKIIS